MIEDLPPHHADLPPQVIGVIQMINKIEFDQNIGTFGDEDVEVLETFAKFVGEKLAAGSLHTSKNKSSSTTGGASKGGDIHAPGPEGSKAAAAEHKAEEQRRRRSSGGSGRGRMPSDNRIVEEEDGG